MCRKWKKTAALGLAVLIGGMMPMSTMLAAEDNTEAAQEVETDFVSDEEVGADDGNAGGEEAKADDGNIGGEMNADDENAADDVTADNGTDPVNGQNVSIEFMPASDAVEAGHAEIQENTDAPVINITLNGESCKVDGLGGGISYQYTNVSNSKLGLSASLNNTPILFCYYLDDNPGDEAKDNDDIPWSGKCSTMNWELSSNKAYVVYMKAEANEQTVYARSCGVVVDTIAPEIVGVEEGGTYPAGTAFTVSDANLDVVMVNETPVTPESDGSYRVRANGTSCVIRAKDKAGNERTCSITVSGGETPGTDNVISADGVYPLKAGVKYHLAEGNWKVDDDKSVYQGDSDFYVKEDGDYKFSK